MSSTYTPYFNDSLGVLLLAGLFGMMFVFFWHHITGMTHIGLRYRLWGTVCSQLYAYFMHSFKDPWYIKFMVGTLNTVFYLIWLPELRLFSCGIYMFTTYLWLVFVNVYLKVFRHVWFSVEHPYAILLYGYKFFEPTSTGCTDLVRYIFYNGIQRKQQASHLNYIVLQEHQGKSPYRISILQSLTRKHR